MRIQKGRNGWDGHSLPFSVFLFSPPFPLVLFFFPLSFLLQLPFFHNRTSQSPLSTLPSLLSTSYIYPALCFFHLVNTFHSLQLCRSLFTLSHPTANHLHNLPHPPIFALVLFETWSLRLVSSPRNRSQSPRSTTRIKDTTLYPHYKTGTIATTRTTTTQSPRWSTTHHCPPTRSHLPLNTQVQSPWPLSPHPCHRRPSSLPSAQIGRKRSTTPSTQQVPLQARAKIGLRSFIPAHSLPPPQLHRHQGVAPKGHQSP